MKYCKYCKRQVNRIKHFRWVGFIFGFGLLYLVYYLARAKSSKCPICNAKL